MKNINITISQLKILDLSTYPINQINKLLDQFGRFSLIQMILHPGKTIIRARPNEDGQHFSTRAELSYKPQNFNTTYQRASTPNSTMFYAGTIPEDIKPGELNNARAVSTLEASNLLRDTDKDGKQTITFSKWVVTKDIPLAAICYHEDFVNKSSHTKELYDSYKNESNNLPAELREKSMAITSFLASEFAKAKINGDYDYMISAIFSERTVSRGLAGIYYPSVRADGMGYNVAIDPQVVDSSLKLLVSGECKIYKKKDRTYVDNETICQINDDTLPFVLYPVPPDYHVGKDKILSLLNNDQT